MSESHGTEHKREYVGEERSRWLLNWLNDKAADPARQRIRELLNDLKIVTADWMLETDPDDGAEMFVFRGDVNRYRATQRRIRALLLRYKFTPMLWGFGPLITSQWTPIAGPDGEFKRKWPPSDGKYDDVQAVFDISWSAEDRSLARIRECVCTRWFFAKFSHQRFCSTKCREKVFRSSPGWKEYRRQKAREYYWLHKKRNTK